MQGRKCAKGFFLSGTFIVVVALAAALCLTAGAPKAYADGAESIDKLKGELATCVYPSVDYYSTYNIAGRPKKITAAKSSNEKVATVEVMNNYWLVVTKKQPGETKISYKIAGKAKSVNMTVVKWENPVKTLKVGSTNYASSLKTGNTYISTGNDLSGKKVKVKASKGWKLKKITAYCSSTQKTVKSGGKLPKTTMMVMVDLQNKSTKVETTVRVAP